MQKVNSFLEKQFYPNITFITWLIALGGTFGSLILSEVMDLIPCTLCWYQRVALFPLAVILGVGYLRKDKNVAYYILPLSIIGAVIAFYQTLLQWNIITEDLLTCSLTNPCSEPDIMWLGFITIPFMSFITFVVITVLMKLDLNRQKSSK